VRLACTPQASMDAFAEMEIQLLLQQQQKADTAPG
jgi:hypothetical protein